MSWYSSMSFFFLLQRRVQKNKIKKWKTRSLYSGIDCFKCTIYIISPTYDIVALKLLLALRERHFLLR